MSGVSAGLPVRSTPSALRSNAKMIRRSARSVRTIAAQDHSRSATPPGFELDSRDFTKTKRDATLAGKSRQQQPQKEALKRRMASVRHHAERTATPSASEVRPPLEKQNRRTSQVPGAAMSMSLPTAAATSNAVPDHARDLQQHRHALGGHAGVADQSSPDIVCLQELDSGTRCCSHRPS